MKNILFLCFPLVLYTMSCKEDSSVGDNNTSNMDKDTLAEVVSVSFTGEENNYTFSVAIKSPDTGCDQYADWWEIISENEELIYRRVLAHSHVNEQPFTRSGGPVKLIKDQKVYVRMHMNTSGYSNRVFTGSVAEGFQKSTLDKTFASELETKQPLPNGCAF